MNIPDFTIEPLSGHDLEAVKALQPAGWGDILPNLRFYLSSPFCYSVKISVAGTIAGIGTAIVHENVTWLANIITHEAFRGQGIGTAITRHLTTYGLDRTGSVLLIATNLGFPVYQKLGYTTDQEYVVFKARPYSEPVSPEVVPYNAQFEEELLQMDYEVTGELRSHVLKPRLEEAFVYRKQQQLLGFCIPALGEGLTIAQDPVAGIALMKKVLHTGKRIVIPVGNTAALTFLAENGFEKDDWYAVKMHIGRPIPWFPEQTFGRIGGNMG